MSIQIIKYEPVKNKNTFICEGEAKIIFKIKSQIGRIEAVRVARAFAQSDLKSAVEFVDQLKGE